VQADAQLLVHPLLHALEVAQAGDTFQQIKQAPFLRAGLAQNAQAYAGRIQPPLTRASAGPGPNGYPQSRQRAQEN
jgi:hypothetical protein